MTKITREIALDARDAGRKASGFTGCVSCARVYVVLVEKADAKEVRALTGGGGFTVVKRGRKPAIYIGYDNATGAEYGRAIAIAKVLSDAGVAAYEDADED